MEMSAKTKEGDLDLYESIVKLVAQTKKHVKAFLYNHKELYCSKSFSSILWDYNIRKGGSVVSSAFCFSIILAYYIIIC